MDHDRDVSSNSALLTSEIRQNVALMRKSTALFTVYSYLGVWCDESSPYSTECHCESVCSKPESIVSLLVAVPYNFCSLLPWIFYATGIWLKNESDDGELTVSFLFYLEWSTRFTS